MERALEKAHIAKDLGELGGLRIALEPAAVSGQHDVGKVRPRRLPGDPFSQLARVHVVQGLLGDDRKVGALLHLFEQIGKVAADVGMHARFAQDALGDHRVAAVWRQNDGALAGRGGRSDHDLPTSGADGPT